MTDWPLLLGVGVDAKYAHMHGPNIQSLLRPDGYHSVWSRLNVRVPCVISRRGIVFHRPRRALVHWYPPTRKPPHISVEYRCGNLSHGGSIFVPLDVARTSGILICARCEEQAIRAGDGATGLPKQPPRPRGSVRLAVVEDVHRRLQAAFESHPDHMIS